jgi:hypothetical protein
MNDAKTSPKRNAPKKMITWRMNETRGESSLKAFIKETRGRVRSERMTGFLITFAILWTVFIGVGLWIARTQRKERERLKRLSPREQERHAKSEKSSFGTVNIEGKGFVICHVAKTATPEQRRRSLRTFSHGPSGGALKTSALIYARRFDFCTTTKRARGGRFQPSAGEFKGGASLQLSG